MIRRHSITLSPSFSVSPAAPYSAQGDEGYDLLRIAILRQAVDDWKDDYRLTPKDGEEKEEGVRYTCDGYMLRDSIESFFFSKWGQMLSGDRGDTIVTKLVLQDFAAEDAS